MVECDRHLSLGCFGGRCHLVPVRTSVQGAQGFRGSIKALESCAEVLTWKRGSGWGVKEVGEGLGCGYTVS